MGSSYPADPYFPVSQSADFFSGRSPNASLLPALSLKDVKEGPDGDLEGRRRQIPQGALRVVGGTPPPPTPQFFTPI